VSLADAAVASRYSARAAAASERRAQTQGRGEEGKGRAELTFCRVAHTRWMQLGGQCGRCGVRRHAHRRALAQAVSLQQRRQSILGAKALLKARGAAVKLRSGARQSWQAE
jgi:hypothetical protein